MIDPEALSPDVNGWQRAKKLPVEIEFRGPFTDTRHVETLEGDFEIDDEYLDEHGSYVIIRGVDGEQYPCATDIFRETYELVGPGETDVRDPTDTDEVVVFRVVRSEDQAHPDAEQNVAGWGVEFPSGMCLLDWNRLVYPPEHRLANAHISQYGSMADVEQVMNGGIEVLHRRRVSRSTDE